jgi:uncharacterized protein YfaS (alpha-2-macroglobulin family)
MFPRRNLISSVLVFSLGVTSLTGPSQAFAKIDDRLPATSQSESNGEPAKEENGLRFRLRAGVDQPESKPAINLVLATELSPNEIESILKRLPPMEPEGDDEQEFALRERSVPPPRTGQTINVSFPQPTSSTTSPAETTSSGALEVLRYAPEGNVPLAPQLSVTFSQPMIAVSSHEQAAANVPVRLTPQPPGKWRWVGTKTLLFDPEERFPMATQYTVTVPAGTRSANGSTLAESKTWGFMTPPPAVRKTYPESGSVNRRDTLMFLEFDQRISPEAILERMRVGSGINEFKVRIATAQEIEADSQVRKLVAAAKAGQWVTLRAVNSNGDPQLALPAGTSITVKLGPGIPSLEGRRLTNRGYDFTFRTFGPLRVKEQQCSYYQTCRPLDKWHIEFSNKLDAKSFQMSLIKVEPEIDDLKTSVYDDTLKIEGNTRARTRYRVTLDPSIRDEFGQSLGSIPPLYFQVEGLPRKLFTAYDDDFAVLDSSRPPQLSVYSVNYRSLRVKIYQVQPSDWAKWSHYRRDGTYDGGTKKQDKPPGTLAVNRTIALKAKPDELTETTIDFSSALSRGFGQMIVMVEGVESVGTGKDDDEPDPIELWAQRTSIGLDAVADHSTLVGWASWLRDGAPIEGVEMTIVPGSPGRTTGPDGTVHFILPEPTNDESVLVSRKGNDVAILPWDSDSYWHKKQAADLLRWYVFDNRKLYRPGDEVQIKGWVRRVGWDLRGDLGLLTAPSTEVAYGFRDSFGNEIAKGTTTLNPLGGFEITVKLPTTVNLGPARLSLRSNNRLNELGFEHTFQVQEFRRPEFEVTAKVASEAPHIVGSYANLSVGANYYAGGALPGAPVSWRVSSTPAAFTPPNRNDFSFGKPLPWIPWWDRDYERQSDLQTFTTATDASGKHHLQIDFESVSPARPSTVVAEASVMDVNRQTVTATATMLVHPSSLYVGLRSERTFVHKGEPLTVESIVTDLEGKAVGAREIKMRAVLLDWQQENGEWEEFETNPQECSVQSAAVAVICTFQPNRGGQYRVTATIVDNLARRNESELTLWATGTEQPGAREVDQERVEVVSDRKEYKAGDTAELLVRAPFYPAEGMMSLDYSGILKTERFRMDGPTYTLRVPIEEAWTPNILVLIHLVGSVKNDAESGNSFGSPPSRPAFATGATDLSIPPVRRKLEVKAVPRDRELEPGGETRIYIEVKDVTGQPVNGSELALAVVDESVLALTNYELADPIAAFYASRSGISRSYHSRGSIVTTVDLADIRAQLKTPPPPNAPPVEFSRELPINLREDFNALALFVASLRTDSNGRAQVQVKLPDNLTRYRVMAIAVAGGKQFGSGESSITARMPLMVRPSAPRFLNFGDQFELPIVLQNQTDDPMTVDLAVRSNNVLLSVPPTSAAASGLADQSSVATGRNVTKTAMTGRRLTVPANDRVELRIPAAAMTAGTARFQIGAVSAGRWSDAAEISVPVWTPATTEAFATYGEIDQGAIAQPIKAPANVFKQFGGLEIETSSTQLQQLTDAFLYLQNYPYECSEQLASRILSVAALREVLTAFKAKELPPPQEIEAAVMRDLKRLQGMQNENGGFGFWKRGEESWPYLSIHVAHALARAKQKKFNVPADMVEKSRTYLRSIESHIPSRYGVDARRALISYALYVRAQTDDRDTVRARKLIAEAGLETLSLESTGWLLSVLSGDPASQTQVAAIRRLLGNRATETAATAHFVFSYQDDNYLLLNSNRRADGVILEALIGDQPTNDLIPKIVRGLLDHRRQGRWANTQENVFILLALDKYFNTYEKLTPDFVARVWLGDAYAGEQQFKGRSVDRGRVNVPMSYLTSKAVEKPSAQNLVVSKEGPGRLYYRLALNYAPLDLNLKSADYGFAVDRSYEAVDHADDVRRDANGTWRIKAGARVRVSLTMAVPSRRHHVALVDHLPAGFESLNPELAVTESIPEDKKQEAVVSYGARSYGFGWWLWRSVWFDHQNLRDDRAEAFTSLLWEGVYTYSYVARATTPGQFIVPPSKAEEMYHPETFGRSGTDRVRIQ